MIEEMKQIARRIREIREISDIPAERMAANLDVSLDQFLHYESGEADIPVSFIFKVAQWFNIELSVLMGGDNPKLHIYGIVRNGKGLNLERRKHYKYENLAYNFIHKKAEPFLVTVDPDPAKEPADFNSHPGQEFNYVLEGSMQIIIDNHEITLNEGDSIYFNSGFKHKMKALDNKRVRFLAVIL
jgi:mannose-6-phosphate isomerase-like protein (cupin superfamily)